MENDGSTTKKWSYARVTAVSTVNHHYKYIVTCKSKSIDLRLRIVMVILLDRKRVEKQGKAVAF